MSDPYVFSAVLKRLQTKKDLKTLTTYETSEMEHEPDLDNDNKIDIIGIAKAAENYGKEI